MAAAAAEIAGSASKAAVTSIGVVRQGRRPSLSATIKRILPQAWDRVGGRNRGIGS